MIISLIDFVIINVWSYVCTPIIIHFYSTTFLSQKLFLIIYSGADESMSMSMRGKQ